MAHVKVGRSDFHWRWHVSLKLGAHPPRPAPIPSWQPCYCLRSAATEPPRSAPPCRCAAGCRRTPPAAETRPSSSRHRVPVPVRCCFPRFAFRGPGARRPEQSVHDHIRHPQVERAAVGKTHGQRAPAGALVPVPSTAQEALALVRRHTCHSSPVGSVRSAQGITVVALRNYFVTYTGHFR